jgi:PAS domain S-box-containing protein
LRDKNGTTFRSARLEANTMLREGFDFEQVLAELARGNVIADGNLQDVLRYLIRRAAEVLNVRRVNIWLTSENKDLLRCIEAFDAASNSFECGEELRAVDYPAYFDALERLRTIAVVDAATDPRTIEMRDTYLRQHQITTMLDAPVFSQGAIVGVVCHEHCVSQRKWLEREKSFAASIADFVSLALEANRRIEAERKLSEAKQILIAVTEQMSDGFGLLEPDFENRQFTFRYVNLQAAAFAGYAPNEIIGKPTSILRTAESNTDLFEIFKRAETEKTVLIESVARHKDGSDFPVEVSFNLIEYERKKMLALVGRDISERRAAENARLQQQNKNLQSQRLESLGLLAGKIAHDFNNLLVGILGNVSLAAYAIAPDDKIKKYLDSIESTAKIAADLCNQLLTYSGKQELDLREVNLPELVSEMIRLLELSLPPNATLRSRSEENMPPIYAEPTQIRQVLLNLITNAADAMTDKSGYIEISVGTAYFTESDLQNKQFDLQAAEFADRVRDKKSVFLSVADNGAGMTSEVKERIFEPFFTTKLKGRGLGMSALSGIVRTHGGAIDVKSELNKGTTVSIWFPARVN